jgi:hypothetical protein
MKSEPRLWAVLGSCVFALGLTAGCVMAPLSHLGGIMVDRWAEVNTDDKTMAEILAAFNGAEEGVRIGDLEKVMAIYSQNCRYHGMTKADLRTIWEAVFAEYHGLNSNHILTPVVVRSNGQRTAEITCSGSLYGVSKKTGELANVDSWYGEVHHVVYEEGAWRVEGHKGEVAKALPFGVAPHPFF